MAPASARRADIRWAAEATSAGSPPSCSPTWSASPPFPSPRDPEEIKNLVDSCFERLVQDINAFGGQGRQDHRRRDPRPVRCSGRARGRRRARGARRAAHAGDVARPTAPTPEPQIQLRIGVNTGEVLVGSLRAGGEYTAMGDVVNTAQRLQTTATPGSVVVGPAHLRRHSRRHRLPLARRRRGQGPRGARRRVGGHGDAAAARLPAAPCADAVRRARRRARHSRRRHRRRGRPAVAPTWCLLLGEAGVGKSRLAAEVAQHACNVHRSLVYEGRCVPYGEANVWWPVAEALRQACAITADEGAASARDLCADAVAAVLEQPADAPEVRRVVERPAPPHGLREPARRDRRPARS